MKKKLYGLSVIILIIDQIIKIIISNNIKIGKQIKIIDKFFYITNVHNDGAAFSMLSGNVIFLILIILLSLIVIHIFFVKDKSLNKIELILTSMLIGGIFGNFIDRIIHRYVIDYLEFIIFNYDFPIFNFADICIVLSVIGLVLYSIKEDLCKNSKLKKKLEE